MRGLNSTTLLSMPPVPLFDLKRDRRPSAYDIIRVSAIALELCVDRPFVLRPTPRRSEEHCERPGGAGNTPLLDVDVPNGVNSSTKSVAFLLKAASHVLCDLSLCGADKLQDAFGLKDAQQGDLDVHRGHKHRFQTHT